MKIDRLETHDRLLEFQKQSDYISQGFLECVKNRPEEFGKLPFYVFAHKREIATDERLGLYNNDLYDSILDPSYTRKYTAIHEIPTHRMIWEPRLTKPHPQENSWLFKYFPETDLTEILWIIPEKALWDQYDKGKISESNIVCESIYLFKNKPEKLAAKDPDDLNDEEIDRIYRQVSHNARIKKGLPVIL